MRKNLMQNFVKKYKNNEIILKEDLFNFFENEYQSLTQSTFLWRLFELKEEGLITKISNDIYKINHGNTKRGLHLSLGEDMIVDALKSVNQFIVDSTLFGAEEKIISIFRLSQLNAFHTHQYAKEIILIEADKFRLGDLFIELHKKLSSHYYVIKDFKSEKARFTLEDKVIVLKPLIKKSPVEKKNLEMSAYITSPKIEKILVDLYTQKDIFSLFDLATIQEIFRNIYGTYNIDFTSLLYYARNRGIQEKIKRFIQETLGLNFYD